ncbi:hypothetical protein G6F31_016556 [Rhizopus arrhizus]|nr:hypothetical protein G6F31_016556 [Rhizopus arrhizus]
MRVAEPVHSQLRRRREDAVGSCVFRGVAGGTRGLVGAVTGNDSQCGDLGPVAVGGMDLAGHSALAPTDPDAAGRVRDRRRHAGRHRHHPHGSRDSAGHGVVVDGVSAPHLAAGDAHDGLRFPRAGPALRRAGAPGGRVARVPAVEAAAHGRFHLLRRGGACGPAPARVARGAGRAAAAPARGPAGGPPGRDRSGLRLGSM